MLCSTFGVFVFMPSMVSKRRPFSTRIRKHFREPGLENREANWQSWASRLIVTVNESWVISPQQVSFFSRNHCKTFFGTSISRKHRVTREVMTNAVMSAASHLHALLLDNSKCPVIFWTDLVYRYYYSIIECFLNKRRHLISVFSICDVKL